MSAPSSPAGKRVAILQSNYIPWKGYFDLIASVDEFILYDDAQYTRSDWRNRNKLKSPEGAVWLTIPVTTKGRLGQRICDVEISRPGWAREHWKTLRQNYSGAAHFPTYAPIVEGWYAAAADRSLSQVNHFFLQGVCDLLGIRTKITRSSDYALCAGKTERLVSLCQQAGAGAYLSGPAAACYLDPTLFAAADIELSYMDYSGYPEYRQVHPPFDHAVTILDLLFNEGPEAPSFLKAGAALLPR